MRKIINRKWITITGSIILVICIFVFIYRSYLKPQNFDKTYDAVVIDVTDNSLVEVTSIKIKGERVPKFPIIRKETKIKNAYIYADYLKFTLEDNTYFMDDIYFSKFSQDLYFVWIQYLCPNTLKQPFKDSEQESYTYSELGPAYLYTTGLYTNNTNLEKFVMSVDRSNSESKNYNQYIIAPAKTLEEALNIYNELINKLLNGEEE